MTNVNLLEVAKGLGLDASRGNDSLTMLAMQATAWVAEGLATADDAESIYLAYAEGVNTSFFGSKIAVDNPKTLKVQVSCFRTFMKPEVAKFGEVHSLALTVRASMKSTDETKSAYNSLVAVNRAQIKKATTMLTQKEIRDLLTPKEKADKQVAELIAALHKKVVELDDTHKPQGFRQVVEAFTAYVTGVASGSELIKAEDKPEDKTKAKAEPKSQVIPENKPQSKEAIAELLSVLGNVKMEGATVN